MRALCHVARVMCMVRNEIPVTRALYNTICVDAVSIELPIEPPLPTLSSPHRPRPLTSVDEARRTVHNLECIALDEPRVAVPADEDDGARPRSVPVLGLVFNRRRQLERRDEYRVPQFCPCGGLRI